METEPRQKRSKGDVSSDADSLAINTVLQVVPVGDRETELFHLVFAIDMLRETIVNFVIHEKGQLSRTNAHSCRLVQHSWHQAVSKCLRDSGEPLFELILWKKSHFEPTSLANQFLRNYASSSRLLDCVPTFSLRVLFCNQVPNTKSGDLLKKFFRYCASGLVSLELHCFCLRTDAHVIDPQDGLSLPVLRKLNIFWFDINSEIIQKCVSMFRMILSASQKLTFLRLDVIENFPVSLGTISLPATITNLNLGRGMTFDYMEKLATSYAVPKLTDLTLTLDIPNDVWGEKDSIYRILDRVRLTLKRLTMMGSYFYGDDWERKTKPIHFPIMKKLLFCSIQCSHWKWAKNAVVSLENSFPVVNKLHITNAIPSTVRQLVETSHLESVERLGINFTLEDPITDPEIALAITKIPTAFPNVTVLNLGITVCTDEPNIFHPIFQKMTQLKELSILFYSEFPVQSDEYWIMMFLGMWPEEITTTKVPYITNLTELRLLTLKVRCDTDIFLPDAVCNYGFRKMPNLGMYRWGKISFSPEIYVKWHLVGRAPGCHYDERVDDEFGILT